jgi:hypothetical protein
MASAGPVLAEVMTSEFFSDPTTEGWELVAEQGDVTSWVADGVFYQDFPNNCPPEPVCDSQALTRSMQVYNGRADWFYEYRCSATGDHTEIPAGAPTVLSAFNAAGNLYHATLAADQVKLSGDADLPILFLDVPEGTPHTIRLELFNDPPPATFHWYVDSVLVLEGLADSPFPDFDSRIGFMGRTWKQPTLNAWYYIRAGDLPSEASGDFDSDGEVDDFDWLYFSECFDRGASGEPAFPSCAWADFDADGQIDLRDFAAFQNAFTGPE